MSTALTTLTSKLAARFDMGDGQGVTEILKNTAFKVKDGAVSDNQMTALLVIANQYGLNPFTKEIYAYPDKSNGIVPVVGVDGWSRIINERPELDGLEFRYSEQTLNHKGKVAHEWIECVITRKDRKAPVVVREYFDEVVRNLNFATPWDTHPKRMHRHKAMIQCARLAFGFGGIYDQDEAERIAEIEINPMPTSQPKQPAELPAYPEADFAKNLEVWRDAIAAGKAKPEQIVSRSSSRYTLSADQIAAIYDLAKPAHIDGDGVIDAEFTKAYEGAQQ